MKSATTKSVIWSLLDTYAGFALKFVFALTITRILSPRDYGLVAYMGLFLGIATFLSEGGFGAALIQKTHATDTDYATAFIFNLVVSILFFILYFAISGFIAKYFNEPDLKLIMRVTSLNLILNSLCYVHLFRLIKSLQFKKQAAINFTASSISGAIGLSTAIIFTSYWALIVQTLSGTFIRMLGYWIAAKYAIKLKFSWISFKEQFRFGSVVFLQGLLSTIVSEIQSLLIGKNYSTASLGNYSRGYKFYDLFIVQTGNALNKVLYPTMAKKKDDVYAHIIIYNKSYSLLFFVMGPLTLFLLLLSESIVKVLLTDKWIAVVPYMQLYFLSGFFVMLASFNSITILSANKPKLYLRMDVFLKILIVGALIVTYKISISAIILGWLAACFIFFICYEIIMFKLSFFSPAKYYNMLNILLCLLPSILLFFTMRTFIENSFLLLMINIILQPVFYFIAMHLGGFQVYEDFVKLVEPFLPRRMAKLL